jgi:hypothetical protein
LGLAELDTKQFLDDFYEVLFECLNSAPVYGRRFFGEFLENFSGESFICRVRHQGKTVVTGFLTGWPVTLHWNYWNASGEQALELKPENPTFARRPGPVNGCL